MATDTSFTPLKGHCTCKTITYEVLAPFLCTSCCHCTWCQRESGSAFALNCIIESSNLRVTSETKPILSDLPTLSGDGQKIARCPNCHIILFCDYGGDSFAWTTFVKAGTLVEQPVKPEIHIFTTTKVDWVNLTAEKERGIPILEKGYRVSEVWRKDARERFELLKQKMKAEKESLAVNE